MSEIPTFNRWFVRNYKRSKTKTHLLTHPHTRKNLKRRARTFFILVLRACFMMACMCPSVFTHTYTSTHGTFFIWEGVPSISSAHSSRVPLCLCVFPDKVNDPVMAVQIAWMMEVPQLYRQCYDKPLQLQSDATGYKRKSIHVPQQ